MEILRKIVRNVKDLIAEKREKMVNKSQQDYYADIRAAALKSLLDPKAKLTGPLRRQLMKNLERPLDPSEGYAPQAPHDAGDKWFRRLLKLSMRRLIRHKTRAAHKITGLKVKHAKAGSREKRLLAPKLQFVEMLHRALGDIIVYRVSKFKAAK